MVLKIQHCIVDTNVVKATVSISQTLRLFGGDPSGGITR